MSFPPSVNSHGLTCVLWRPGSHRCQTGRICPDWDSVDETQKVQTFNPYQHKQQLNLISSQLRFFLNFQPEFLGSEHLQMKKIYSFNYINYSFSTVPTSLFLVSQHLVFLLETYLDSWTEGDVVHVVSFKFPNVLLFYCPYVQCVFLLSPSVSLLIQKTCS